jgi:endonuclease/exonuclease/phosphatase family metal-dependent hydrolase
MKRLFLALISICLICALLIGCAPRQSDLSENVAGVGGNISSSEKEAPKEPAEGPQPSAPQEPSQKEEQPQILGQEEEQPQAEEPSFEEEQAKDYSNYITVVSYNVKHFNLGTSTDDIIALLKKMDGDIVGLQEISEGYVAAGNQVELLAKQCGYPYYYFCTSKTASGDSGRYGSGVLSRYPIKSSENGQFDFKGGQDRRYSRLVLQVEDREIVYYNTHLLTGRWEDTGKQYTELLNRAKKEKFPVVITGDFNLNYQQLCSLTDLKRFTPLNGGPTGLVGVENISYDNIVISAKDFDYYTNERNMSHIMTIVSDASDHNPVYSYIKLK